MSSPGAGKTTLLERIAEHLKPKYKMAVIEGDIETERDAERIRAKGILAWLKKFCVLSEKVLRMDRRAIHCPMSSLIKLI